MKLQAIRDADEVALARRRREQRIAEFQREEALHQDRRRLVSKNLPLKWVDTKFLWVGQGESSKVFGRGIQEESRALHTSGKL